MASDRPSGWVLDPQTRLHLRLEKADRAIDALDWSAALVELEELLDEDPGHKEALWRLLEVLVEQRDFLTGREAARALVDAGGARPSVWCSLALCAFECCAFEESASAARRAIEGCEDLAEAHHLLGTALERLDDASARSHLRSAHRMSPLTYPLPLRLTDEDWRIILADAFEMLPPQIQAFWEPVSVELHDFPDPAELLGHVPQVSPRIGALYEGPAPEVPDGTRRPESIRIFKGNLTYADSPNAVAQQLSLTLEQEAMDWLPRQEG